MVYAQVIVASRTNVQELTYAVPASIIPYIKVGTTVEVPLRRRRVRGVVIGLRRQIPRQLQGKLRELLAIDRTGEGFSSAQIATIKSLADQTGASLGEIAYTALAYPSRVSSLPIQTHQPTFIQASWSKRLAFYVKLATKYHAHKRVVIVAPTKRHVSLLANALVDRAVAIEPASAAKTQQISKVLSSDAPLTLIGAQALSFFPLRPGDLLIIDSPDHVGQISQRRPYLTSKRIGIARAAHEGIRLFFGAQLPSVTDYPKKLRRQWRFAVDRTKNAPLTVINRHQVPQLLADTFQERLLAAKNRRVIILVASKGFSPVVYCPTCQDVWRCPRCHRPLTLVTETQVDCRLCGWTTNQASDCPTCGGPVRPLGEGSALIAQTIRSLLPNQEVVEISSDTSDLPSARLIVATEKILSFPDAAFDTVFFASVDRMLMAANPDGAWHLLEILLSLSARAKEVIVQTHFPNHWVWSAAAQNKLDDFYHHELTERQRYGLPPYSLELKLFGRSARRQSLEIEANRVGEMVGQLLPTAVVSEPVFTRPAATDYQASVTIYAKKSLSRTEHNKLRGLLPFSWYFTVG